MENLQKPSLALNTVNIIIAAIPNQLLRNSWQTQLHNWLEQLSKSISGHKAWKNTSISQLSFYWKEKQIYLTRIFNYIQIVALS